MHGTRPRSSNAISSKDSMLGRGCARLGRSVPPCVLAVVLLRVLAARAVMALVLARRARGVALVVPAMVRACARAAVVGLARPEHVAPVAAPGGAVSAVAVAHERRARGLADEDRTGGRQRVAGRVGQARVAARDDRATACVDGVREEVAQAAVLAGGDARRAA